MDSEKIDALLQARPRLHNWGDGGLEDRFLRQFIEKLGQLHEKKGPLRLIETGAGLSTLLLLACRPARLVSIAPDAELRSRIVAAADRFGVDVAPLEYVCSPSEDALPEISRSEQFDCGLIDGYHSYPSVFVDFFYINRALGANSLLAIDDLHLGSGRELFQLVRAQPEYDVELLLWKTAVFRKTAALRIVPEMCPYNRMQSYNRLTNRS